ncbi:LytTR family two component transcriptional regulator [Mucilaginibacter gracilis]|uniref:LytTR family two component transcriptional regulator n=1 Tax=Mucilaginibacter gracilis TaxID=423350 RepID=A0A495IZI3_9SPHI|nr:LytTR family DNA-binding domain-containing protein [Mucilaginibacter gracilis]RKR82125.1 LytTR family two component transcriptional regulator [Mucilaginibacter gracilis]
MKCLIVDDEPLARKGVQLHLKKYPELELAGCFNNATAAAAYLLLNPVGLIFLDIRMPGINGLEFARSLGKQTMVIFITAFAEYALDSYEVDAIGYLVKPIHPERFDKAVLKALAYERLFRESPDAAIEFVPDHLLVRSERQFIRIALDELQFIEGLKDYVILYLNDQKVITAMNLKQIHQKLPQERFLRVSKSYIVNTSFVKTFDNNAIYIGENEVPIGNAFRDAFFEIFVRQKMIPSEKPA